MEGEAPDPSLKEVVTRVIGRWEVSQGSIIFWLGWMSEMDRTPLAGWVGPVARDTSSSQADRGRLGRVELNLPSGQRRPV